MHEQNAATQLLNFAKNVTCGRWKPGLADGFDLHVGHKFVMLRFLPLVLVRHYYYYYTHNCIIYMLIQGH